MIAKRAEELEITAKQRDKTMAPKAARKAGMLPAVLYGKEIDSVSLLVAVDDFEKLYKEAGATTIIDLQIEGEAEPRAVLVKELQLDPATDRFIHIDFYQIKVGEKLRATIPLRFEGDPPAVKDFGGILVTNKDNIEVECLPRNLPRDIEVNLSGLKEIEDSITVGDLKIPPEVEVLDEPDESVVVITPPAAEEAVAQPVSEEEAVASVKATEEKVEGEAEADQEATQEPTKKPGEQPEGKQKS